MLIAMIGRLIAIHAPDESKETMAARIHIKYVGQSARCEKSIRFPKVSPPSRSSRRSFIRP